MQKLDLSSMMGGPGMMPIEIATETETDTETETEQGSEDDE